MDHAVLRVAVVNGIEHIPCNTQSCSAITKGKLTSILAAVAVAVTLHVTLTSALPVVVTLAVSIAV